MKKNFKSLISLMLIVIFMMVTVTSCTPPEVEDDTPTPQVNNETESSEDTTSEDTIVIKAVIKDMSADDPVSLQFLDNVSEKVSTELGKDIKIELVPISDGTYSESMSLYLQSGSIPDLMYFQGSDYQFAITQEILEDLTPYIESSTNVKALMQPFNNARVENYPYLLWLSSDRVKVPVVREDWLNEMDSKDELLSNPTPENYKKFFTELKEKKSLDSAYTVPGNLAELDTIFDLAFGVEQTWINENGEYVYKKVSEAEKNKLAFYAELYSEGLLDSEYLSKKWDTKEAAFYNGETGVVAGTAGAVVNIYNNKMVSQNGEGSDLVVLPPATGVSQGYTPSDVSKESRGWAISAYSEYKEEIFAILEYMAGYEGQIFDKLGYEGEHHNVNDNVYTLTDKISEWYPRFHESIANFQVTFDENTPYYSQAAISSLDNITTYASLDNAFILPDEYVTYLDACENLYAEYASEVVSGKKSIDTFDDFVQQWYSLGGQQITDYANETLQ